jgi:hypothetical protein
VNWPKLLTGLGALYTGGKTIKSALDESRAEKRAGNQAELADGENGAGPKMTVLRVKSIEERVSYIVKAIQKGKHEPRVHEFARKAVTKKCGKDWCVAERDWQGEQDAVFLAVRQRVRYTLDTHGVDLFMSAKNILRFNSEDCDGATIILGSALQAIGHPVMLPVYWLKGAKSWGHISLYGGLPPQRPTRWRSLDASVNEEPGWEVPRAHVKKKLVFKVP